MLREFHSYLFLRSITKQNDCNRWFCCCFKENFDVYYLIENCNNSIFFIVKHEEIFKVINEMKMVKLVKFSKKKFIMNFLRGKFTGLFHLFQFSVCHKLWNLPTILVHEVKYISKCFPLLYENSPFLIQDLTIFQLEIF